MLRTFGGVVVLGVLSSATSSHVDDATDLVDEDSCESDGISLLQLPPHRAQSLLSAQGRRGDTCPQVGARAYVTTAALAYITDQLFPFAYVDIQDGLVPMDPIVGGVTGFDCDISSIKLLSVAATSVVFELVEGRGIKVQVLDVALSAVMGYRLSSSSFWTSMFSDSKGVLSATIGSGSSVSFTIVFGSPGAPTNITFVDIGTQLNINKLDFDAPGSLDDFINWLDFIFRPILQGFLQDAVTGLIAKQSIDIAAKVDDALQTSAFPFPLQNEAGPFPYNVDVRLCGFTTGSDHVAFDSYAVVGAPASGAYDGQGYDLSSTDFVPDHSAMLGVGVTGWTVNGFVWLAYRVIGLLAPESASADPSGPVPFSAESGTLADGRDLKAGAHEIVEELANQLQLQLFDEAGITIDDISLLIFNRALGAAANFDLDLKQLLDHTLGEEVRSRTKLGAVATEEHDRIDPPAAWPTAMKR